MNQEDLKTRIQELVKQYEQAQGFIQKLSSDVLTLQGAIQENQNWLNKLNHEEAALLIAQEKANAKRTKKRRAKRTAKVSTPAPVVAESSSEESIAA